MNILSKSFKRINKQNISALFLLCFAAFAAQAQETQPDENKQGYISDDLSIFMHAGPGTNYRILGTINAGAEIQTTGKSSNDYSEIVTDKNRLTWVESKYLTSQPGLRFVVDELNNKLLSANQYTIQLDGQINELKSTIELLQQEKEKLQNENTQIQLSLQKTQSQVKDQDTNIKKQWFFNGAIVLGIGLILGLILPKFFTRRRSMDNWS